MSDSLKLAIGFLGFSVVLLVGSYHMDLYLAALR